jgi:pentatricopeptide repeat protein
VKGKGGWKAASVFLSEARGRKLPKKVQPRTFEYAHTIFGIVDGTKDPELAKLASLRYILQSIQESGANPDHATYSLKMFYYARVAKDVESVKRLYRSMVSSGLRPNAYHVAALIEACCIAGHVHNAEDVLASAQANQLTVNRVHYSLIICAYGDQGNPDKGHEVFQRMLRENVTPDMISLECLVRGYFMIHDYETARAMLFRYWDTVAPRSTAPNPNTSLGDALSLFRDIERQQRPQPPTLGEAANPVMKDILQKWRKVMIKQQVEPPTTFVSGSLPDHSNDDTRPVDSEDPTHQSN